MKNQFILVGNVGQKPELKESKNGNKYLQFSVAVNESFKKKDSTEFEQKTTWFNCVVFDRRAEGLSKILDKGSNVVVSGKLTVKQVEVGDKKMNSVDLIVEDVTVFKKGE